MALTNLQAIQTKVRRLTRSPSEAQLSTSDLDQYINTFFLYDFPEHLRLFSLRQTLTFYTQPGVDVYATNDIPNDPLNNFQNKYIAVHPPVFISGIPAFFTQWRDVFYGQWPQTNQVENTQINGDGSTGPFTGVLSTFPQVVVPATGPNTGAILQNSMIFTCLDTNGTAMILVDYPISNTTGALGLPTVPQTTIVPYGFINYQTGQFSVTFPNPTLAGDTNPIYAEFVPYIPGKPISVLYYNNEFTIRPVPDKSYPVQIEVDVRPTELLSQNQIPYIEQWWQFLAFGCSKKIFEDRMDMDSVNMIMPAFKEQMNLVNRTSLTQQANERTVTIYTQGKSYGWGWYNQNFPF